MAPTPHNTALALRCRPAGTLVEVVHDELGMAPRIGSIRSFSNIVAASSLRKASRFLKTIQASQCALDWELNIALPHGVVPLFFCGCVMDRDIVIIGTKEPLSAIGVPPGLAGLCATMSSGPPPAIEELQARTVAKLRSGGDLETLLSRLKTVAFPESVQKTKVVRKAIPRQMNLLQMAAHDLRNPISGVLAASEYLLEDAAPKLEEHQVTLLRSIESSSRLILQMIEKLIETPSNGSRGRLPNLEAETKKVPLKVVAGDPASPRRRTR